MNFEWNQISVILIFISGSKIICVNYTGVRVHLPVTKISLFKQYIPVINVIQWVNYYYLGFIQIKQLAIKYFEPCRWFWRQCFICFTVVVSCFAKANFKICEMRRSKWAKKGDMYLHVYQKVFQIAQLDDWMVFMAIRK